jgi:hypothetical protein
MKLIKPSLAGVKLEIKMFKLTKEEKKQLIRELRLSGWTGSMDDSALLTLANKILDCQFKKMELINETQN